MKWRKLIAEGKYAVEICRGKGRNYLEQVIIWSGEEENTGEGKGGKYHGDVYIVVDGWKEGKRWLYKRSSWTQK